MRNGWFCWINFVCMIAVVHAHLLHSGSPVWVNKLVTLAVPLFSIVAGYSWGGMLKKTKGAGAIYGLKLFLYPYLFWATVYFLLNNVIMDVVVKHESFDVSFGDFAYLFLTGMVGVQLWFMPALLFISMLTAQLYCLKMHKVVYVVMLSVLAVATLIFSGTMFFNESMRVLWYVRFWMCWMIPYFLIGVIFSVPMASKYTIRCIKQYVLPSLWVCGLTSFVLFHRRGSETLLVLAIFSTALAFPKIYTPKWLVATAPYIMGIYLSHVVLTAGCNFAIEILKTTAITEYIAWPLSLLSFFIVWMGVWVMRKIPFLKGFV